jgi:hypothetical protein
MRWIWRVVWPAAGLLGLACRASTVPVAMLPAPQHLVYQLDPSGDPTRPAGILLAWDDVASPELASYRVYSRDNTGAAFGLRGETTSNTFHDNGVPALQYFVTAVDVAGGESAPSNLVTVDERLQLPAPASLASISLDSAIHLDWADNAFLAAPARFKWYRVYSASYDLDRGLCGADWALEGTTVAHEFLAAQLANGVPRCFGVSAISVEGYESLWSPLAHDTPRPDARNVLVWAYGVNAAASGFRFWFDANANGYGDPGELGLVQDGNRTDIDFWVYLDPTDSSLWFVPEFAGTAARLYQNAPVADLTAIDVAPATGYGRARLEAVPGYGYVFERVENGQVHYAALRVSAVSRQYVIFDWSVQTDPGNPELVAPRRPPRGGAPAAGSR